MILRIHTTGCMRKKVDSRLRIVTVPGVHEEARRKGVDTEKTKKIPVIVMFVVRVLMYVVSCKLFCDRFGIGVRIIFTTNVLVDKIRNLNSKLLSSNALQND